MSTNAPTVDETLVTSPTGAGERRGLPRNLHWIIIGFLVLVLGVVVLSAAFEKSKTMADEDKTKEETERKAALAVDRPTDPNQIVAIRNDQEATVPIIQPQQQKLPAVPDDGEGAGGGGTAARTKGGMSQEEKEEAKSRQEREMAISASPLLAIKGNVIRANEVAANASAFVKPGSAADLQRLREEAMAQMVNRASGVTGPGGATQQQLMAQQVAAQQLAAQQLAVQRQGGQGGANGGMGGSVQSNQQWLANQQGQPQQQVASRPLGIEYPTSRTPLFQGTVIPVALVTALNSDMPGQIVAQATTDVYDSIRGEALIVPRHTKFFGAYNAEVHIGQERALAAFQRMMRPDGSYVNLMGMPAADAIGQSGLPGEVDNHFIKMFGASFATAGLAALFDRRNNSTVIVGGSANNGAVRTAAGDILVDVARKINDRNTTIQPTITVPPGEKFVITITRDIDIPPYHGRLPGQ